MLVIFGVCVITPVTCVLAAIGVANVHRPRGDPIQFAIRQSELRARVGAAEIDRSCRWSFGEC